jgi:hypothetical protein
MKIQKTRSWRGTYVVYYHAQADGLVFKKRRRFFTSRVNVVKLQTFDDGGRAESFFKAIAPGE